MDKPFIVYRPGGWRANEHRYSAGRVERESDKQISLAASTRPVHPNRVVARFADAESAAKLVQALEGARGEYQRRVRAAGAACAQACDQLIRKAVHNEG